MPAIGALAIGVSAIGALPVSVGYEQVGIDSVSGLDVPDGAHLATIVAEGAAVRYRDDGNDPTAGVGMPIAVAEPIHYVGNLTALRFVGQAPGAILNVLYYATVNPIE